MKKNKKIRWGLVGLGAQGERLARALKNVGMPLIGVASHDKKHTEEFAKRFRAKAYTWTQLLKDPKIDAVGIATPNNEHARQAIAALLAGREILCEKPLALSLAEGRKIERAAKASRARSVVDFHLRAHPAVRAARDSIRSGKLGDIRYIDMHWSVGTWGKTKLPPLPKHMRWREDFAKSGGGALMARGVHLFDLLRFLTGREVTDVRAYADGEIDRTTAGVVVLDKKIPATLVTSKNIPGAHNRIVIYGSKARVGILDVFSLDKRATLEIQDTRGTRVRTFPKQDIFANVFKEFARDPRLLASISDGVAVIKIAEAWKKSVREKSATKVE